MEDEDREWTDQQMHKYLDGAGVPRADDGRELDLLGRVAWAAGMIKGLEQERERHEHIYHGKLCSNPAGCETCRRNHPELYPMPEPQPKRVKTPCSRCHGDGQIYTGACMHTCPECNGKGRA